MTDWPIDNQGRLSKTFEFKNIEKALPSDQVAMLSEKNHHPQIVLDYNKVIVSLISHDVQSTQRDIDLANQIDKLYLD